jgi:hypothetical protein
LFSREGLRGASFLGDPPSQGEGGAVLAGVVVGNVQVMVAAAVGVGGLQSSGEGPLGGAAGPAQQEGQGVLDGEVAQEVVLVGLELVEVVDLLGQPLGERRGGSGELVRAGEDQGVVARGGAGIGVGALPFGFAFGVPPGVDLVEGPFGYAGDCGSRFEVTVGVTI